MQFYKNESLAIRKVNEILAFFQQKCEYLNSNSKIIQNIDNIIFTGIITVILASLFCSSEILGYIALLVFGLTILKIFIKDSEQLYLNRFENNKSCRLDSIQSQSKRFFQNINLYGFLLFCSTILQKKSIEIAFNIYNNRLLCSV